MKFLLVANWKMNPKRERSAIVLARAVRDGLQKTKNAEVVLCPPFPFLRAVQRQLRRSALKLGSQDMQISPAALKSLGCSFAILGHSEFRKRTGETDAMVNKKVVAALRAKLIPIICVENKQQLKRALVGISKNQQKQIVIAYEPSWAISTNAGAKVANPRMAARTITALRVLAPQARFLYGGSVSSQTIAGFLQEKSVQGFLIGQASLRAKEFLRIVKMAQVS